MATAVPTEQKKGMPWWVWALLALLLIGLIWFFVALGDDTEEGAANDPAATATATEVSEPTATDEPEAVEGQVTDLTVFFDAEDPASLVGSEVQLQQGAAVQSVVGDKTFWVGPGQDQQLFVFLEEEGDPAGVEGMVDVNAGQQVTISGTIEKLPPIEEARSQFELSEENSVDLEGQEVYLRAEQVEVLEK